MSRREALGEVLWRQHALIGRLLSRVMDAPGQARAALAELQRYVALHESAEQCFLHPAALAGTGDAQGVQRRMAEEREISSCFARLDLMRPDSADFMIQLGLLEEALLAHCSAEEQVELTALASTTDGEQLDRIARGMDLVDEWFQLSGPSSRTGSTGPPDQEPAPSYTELHRRGLQAFDSVSRIL